MIFFAMAHEILVVTPPGAVEPRQALFNAVHTWNHGPGRRHGLLLLPTFLDAECGEETLSGDISRWKHSFEWVAGVTSGESMRVFLSQPADPDGEPPLFGPTVGPGQIQSQLSDLLAGAFGSELAAASEEESVVAPQPSQTGSAFSEPARTLAGEWELEKSRRSCAIQTAKRILGRLESAVAAAVPPGSGAETGGFAQEWTRFQREAALLKRYRLRMDRGESYAAFWLRGDRLFVAADGFFRRLGDRSCDTR